jgi:NitT/TauT family transport system substrate-binding protein
MSNKETDPYKNREWRELRKWIGLTLFLLLSVVVAGCSSGANTAKESGTATASGEKIVIGFNTWPGCQTWYIAKEKGFFKKYGLNVEIVNFPVFSDQLAAVTSGKLDVSCVTIGDMVVPLSKGIKYKIVGVHDISNGGDAMVVNSSITSMQGLKGKKIATELGTVDHLLMLVGLQKAGLKESDVQFTNMSMNDAGPALISGKLDGASLYEPFVSQSLKGGANKVIFSSADVPGLISDLIVAKGDFAKNHPEDVKNLLRAYYDSMDYWQQHPDESLGIMAKAIETPVDEFKSYFGGIKMFDIDQAINAFGKRDDYSSLFYSGNETAKFLKGLDMISSNPNLDEALDVHYLEEIKKERSAAK